MLEVKAISTAAEVVPELVVVVFVGLLIAAVFGIVIFAVIRAGGEDK